MATEKTNFGSTPNLSARSYSRSRSRENSAEENHEWSTEAAPAEGALKPLKDLPKLGSFEEEKEDKEKVTEEDQEEVVDFWGTSD